MLPRSPSKPTAPQRRAGRRRTYLLTHVPSIRSTSPSRSEHHRCHGSPNNNNDNSHADDSCSVRSSASSHEPTTPNHSAHHIRLCFASSPVHSTTNARNGGRKRMRARLDLVKVAAFCMLPSPFIRQVLQKCTQTESHHDERTFLCDSSSAQQRALRVCGEPPRRGRLLGGPCVAHPRTAADQSNWRLGRGSRDASTETPRP